MTRIRNINLKYGKQEIALSIPESNFLDVLWPSQYSLDGAPDEVEILREALAHPTGSPPLRELARNKQKVCILVSDITRPAPSYKLLPPLLDELYAAGIRNGQIQIIFGLGSHRPHTEEEMKLLVGPEVFAAIQCLDHRPDDCVWIGATKQGLPVEIFKPVLEADLKICTGNIDLHYFAGYTGGAKAIMPGVSSRASIAATHRFMLDPSAVAGNLETNPARAAIDEVGALVKIDFIFNVVLDEHKRIVAAVAGDQIRAHRAGCKILDKLFKVKITEKADIVVVSAGGFPKDINLYQAQKALDNAKHAVKDGGTVILAAKCSEGFGEEVFKEWMFAANKPLDILDRVKHEFVLGGHKAVAIAMLLQKAGVILVSDLDRKLTERLFFEYAPSLQQALDLALTAHAPSASVRVIPFGGATLPFMNNVTENKKINGG